MLSRQAALCLLYWRWPTLCEEASPIPSNEEVIYVDCAKHIFLHGFHATLQQMTFTGHRGPCGLQPHGSSWSSLLIPIGNGKGFSRVLYEDTAALCTRRTRLRDVARFCVLSSVGDARQASNP